MESACMHSPRLIPAPNCDLHTTSEIDLDWVVFHPVSSPPYVRHLSIREEEYLTSITSMPISSFCAIAGVASAVLDCGIYCMVWSGSLAFSFVPLLQRANERACRKGRKEGRKEGSSPTLFNQLFPIYIRLIGGRRNEPLK